ncbi:MAG: hypothetical protein NVV62_14395 [Terricaulis sp.]|nr:hypothetical protein [Terricaulis sp.]
MKEAGLSEGEAQLACPKGAFDLFDAFAARADAAMLEALGALDLESMRIREKVRAAVQARLEAQAPYKGRPRHDARARAARSRPGSGALAVAHRRSHLARARRYIDR